MWDERYSQPGHVYGLEPNDFLRAWGARLEGPVLCLAEGDGRNSVWLAGQGLEVHAVEQSAVGVRKTLELASERNVVVHANQGDLADWDLGEARWGAIISIWAHVPGDLRRDLHRRVVRALKPGGRVLIEAYTPDQIGFGVGGPKTEDRCMTLAGLTDELEGLAIESGAELQREIDEGIYHQGLSAVVQAVFRKADQAPAD